MKAKCGHCQGRHDTVEQYRECSIINTVVPLPPDLKKRIKKATGDSKKSEHPLLDEMRKREEKRHQEALKKRGKPAYLRRSVTTDSAVVETRGEHTLNGYVGAGVHEMDRALKPWAGRCTCKAWRGTYGSRVTLVAMWHVHVDESEVGDK